jgi:hypothetical protein
MAQFLSGVSAGAAVTSQTSGVSLTLAGDYAILYVSNSSPPAGPDATALITLSGDATGASVNFEKMYAAGTSWTTLASVNDATSGLPVSSPYTVPTVDTDLNAVNIAGLYAIRVYLNADVSDGTLLVQGQSTPGDVAGSEAAQLAQMIENNTLLKAQVLALSDQANTDYLTAVGGSW